VSQRATICLSARTRVPHDPRGGVPASRDSPIGDTSIKTRELAHAPDGKRAGAVLSLSLVPAPPSCSDVAREIEVSRTALATSCPAWSTYICESDHPGRYEPGSRSLDYMNAAVIRGSDSRSLSADADLNSSIRESLEVVVNHNGVRA